MNTEYTRRPVSIIDFRDPITEVLHPQLTTIVGHTKSTNGKRYLDFGAFCYERRKRRAINRHAQYEGMLVDDSSFEPSRLPVVSKLIEFARSRKTFESAKGFYEETRYFINWLDAQEENYRILDPSSCSKAYIAYTEHLVHRVNSSSARSKPLSRSSASSLQTTSRKILNLATGVSEIEVEALTTPIRQSGQQEHINLKQIGADAQARTFATLVNFIHEAHRILVKNGEFPMRLSSPGSKPYFIYSLHQETSKTKNAKISIASFIASCPQFPSWEQVTEHFSSLGNGKLNHLYKVNYHTYKERFLTTRDSKSLASLRLQIANHSITAGMLAFIAATGCNLSVAQNLDIENCQLIPSTQGQRFLGVKPRANGKTVAPEFGARFTPTFKKILEIREWLLAGKESNRVFSIAPKGTNNIGFVATSALATLKKVLNKFCPHIKWVTATQWRKNISYQYISLSGGDTSLTAEKLSNTESTLAKNYTRPALDEFASQISNLFELIHSAAVARTRTKENIEVRIVSQYNPDNSTSVGSCAKADTASPQRAAGFTEQAPKPSCRDPETCLFCDFYSVHADEDDIRRLLSLRYIVISSKSQQNHERWEQKFGPIVHRIDEVLSAISCINTDLPRLICQVKDEVESGYLDPFWSIHLDTMIDIGALS